MASVNDFEQNESRINGTRMNPIKGSYLLVDECLLVVFLTWSCLPPWCPVRLVNMSKYWFKKKKTERSKPLSEWSVWLISEVQ